mmetsp:Transcript_22476/g.45133  ORF Transcript_22476/g.45133 Transcript_22476/m.45133 type:complete len:82 (-) Transcript_22476:37-282(-)
MAGRRILPLLGGALVCAVLLLVATSYSGSEPTLRVPSMQMRRSSVAAPRMDFTGPAACQRLRSDVARRGVNDRVTEQKVIF